jgi:sulfoxide reductase heme-binding subunit YedZ
MQTAEPSKRRNTPKHSGLSWLAGLFLFVLFAALGYLAHLILLATGFETPLTSFTSWLFSINSVQLWWYVTRASGLVAYLLLWLSTAWGLAVTSKIFDPFLTRDYTYDFHQYLSLFSLGFVVIHVVVLMLDRYLPFSLLQVLAPFLSSYRPLWVGLGVISLYLLALVTVTFYLRKQIGMRAFRWIHVLSLLGYLGVTLHALYAGTDSTLSAAKLIYEGSFLTVVFLTAYWLVNLALGKLKKPVHTR